MNQEIILEKDDLLEEIEILNFIDKKIYNYLESLINLRRIVLKDGFINKGKLKSFDLIEDDLKDAIINYNHYMSFLNFYKEEAIKLNLKIGEIDDICIYEDSSKKSLEIDGFISSEFYIFPIFNFKNANNEFLITLKQLITANEFSKVFIDKYKTDKYKKEISLNDNSMNYNELYQANIQLKLANDFEQKFNIDRNNYQINSCNGSIILEQQQPKIKTKIRKEIKIY